MAEDKHKPYAGFQDQNSILGPHQTPEEIRKENKRRKMEQEEAARQKRRRKYETSSQPPHPKQKKPINALAWLTAAGGLLLAAGIVVLIVVGVNAGWFGDGKSKAPQSGYFTRPDDEPEMSEEGIKGVIREAYFTKDKHLAVKLLLSNGLPSRHYLTSLEVKIRNEDGELVASGYTETIPDDFLIEPNSTAYFVFYISPEYVQLPKDDLDSLTYEINTKGRVEDPSVLETRTTAPSTTTT